MTVANAIAVWIPHVAAASIPLVVSAGACAASVAGVELPRTGDFVLDPARSVLGTLPYNFRHSLFTSDPQRVFHAVGLLAATKKGPEVFGVTGLLSKGHLGIAAAIQDRFGEIERLLWGGEFVVQPTESGPQLTDVNETSGYLSALLQRTSAEKGSPIISNSVENLASRLRASSPVAVHSAARFLGFDSAPLHYHPIIAGFTDNFRHAVGKTLWLFGQGVIEDEILANHSPGPIHKALQEQIEAVKYLKAFCELIREEDPSLIPGLDGFTKKLERILDGKKLTKIQYQSMVSVFTDLNYFYTTHLQDNQNNRYDLFVFS